MEVTPTALPEVLLIRPRVFGDDRGSFSETYSLERYGALGIGGFVQDNLSVSRRGVIRGLHLQHPTGQGKLVWVAYGEVFDVAVDVRVGSPNFGRWVGVRLSSAGREQLWVPTGFAHGFCALSEEVCFAYKCTAPYAREHELGVAFDDPDLGIDWSLPPSQAAIVSERDRVLPKLAEIPEARLPRWSPP